MCVFIYAVASVCVCVHIGFSLSVHKYSLPYKSLMHDVIWPACNPMTRGDSPYKLNILVIEWFTIYLQSVRFAFFGCIKCKAMQEECNRVTLYYFSYYILYIKLKKNGAWLYVIPIKIVIKHFWTLGYSRRFVPYKREYTKKQIATLLELFSPIIQWTNPSSYNRVFQLQFLRHWSVILIYHLTDNKLHPLESTVSP